MRKVQHAREIDLPTLPPGAKRTFPTLHSKEIGERELAPKISVLIKDVEGRGPNRSAALRDLKKMASRYGKEELWEAANAMLAVIRGKEEPEIERIEALEAIPPVLNEIRRKIEMEGKGAGWSAESQAGVQGALPKLHPKAVLQDGAEDAPAEGEKFWRGEILRERALIRSLNSIALGETFDNGNVAEAVREAILKLDAPCAKKLVVERAARRISIEPGERAGEEEAGAPPESQEKRSIEEIFDLPEDETDFSDVG